MSQCELNCVHVTASRMAVINKPLLLTVCIIQLNKYFVFILAAVDVLFVDVVTVSLLTR